MFQATHSVFRAMTVNTKGVSQSRLGALQPQEPIRLGFKTPSAQPQNKAQGSNHKVGSFLPPGCPAYLSKAIETSQSDPLVQNGPKPSRVNRKGCLQARMMANEGNVSLAARQTQVQGPRPSLRSWSQCMHETPVLWMADWQISGAGQ